MSKPSDAFIARTRRPDSKGPTRFEPSKKEPGHFVLTNSGLVEVKDETDRESGAL